MAERRIPTREEVLSYLHEKTNWGRWGKDDQVGAINLITPGKESQSRVAGALGPQPLPQPPVSQRAQTRQSASRPALDEDHRAR